MYDTVLVPLDGSTFSEQALPAAAAIAARAGATVRLALIHTPLSLPSDELAAPPTFGEWEMEYRDRERRYMEARAEWLTDQGLAVEIDIRDGDVGRELTRLADESDLAVLATHGRGGLERAWLGSVADSLVRHATAPVLLIRPDQAEGDDAEPASAVEADDPGPVTLPPFSPPGHILAATDGSDAASAAVEQAVRLAGLFEAKLTLLRVVAFPGGMASPYIPHTAEMDRAAVDEGVDAARTWLAEQAERFQDLTVETVVAQSFQPARGILTEAEESGAELIAVGTRHRTALGRVVLGSTADKVVRASHVPVLVGHAPASE